MTEAWMKRRVERQEFLKSIQRLLYGELNETNRYNAAQMQILLRVAFSEFLAQQGRIRRPLYDGSQMHMTLLRTLLFDEVWPAVESFARTPEEAMALMADLFRWSSESVTESMRGPLRTREIEEPETGLEECGPMDW